MPPLAPIAPTILPLTTIGNTAFTTFPDRPVASEGGLPIVVNGRIVGAIGASGGTGQQNGVAAGAGVAAAR